MQNPKYLPWDQERWPIAAFFLGDSGVMQLERTRSTKNPVCAKCGLEVNLVMDPCSFTDGSDDLGHALVHARCVWLAERFHNEAERAPEEWPDEIESGLPAALTPPADWLPLG